MKRCKLRFKDVLERGCKTYVKTGVTAVYCLRIAVLYQIFFLEQSRSKHRLLAYSLIYNDCLKCNVKVMMRFTKVRLLSNFVNQPFFFDKNKPDFI